MSKAIYIDGSENEVRVARIEDGKLQDLFIERSQEKHCAGNIYKGVVASIVPGIQAAFLDVGLEKNGFLYVDDVLTRDAEKNLNEGELEGEEFLVTRHRDRGAGANIKNLLKEGQIVTVQVTKDPIGTKGARLTCYISLPGRYMVYMPGVRHRGVSRKIANIREKTRLRDIARSLKLKFDSGVIIRTVGEGRTKRDFDRDLRYLERIWLGVEKQEKESPAPALLHTESNILVRVLRDTLTEGDEKIVVESKELHRAAKDFLANYARGIKIELELHKKAIPLFEAHSLEKEIEKLYRKKIWLKCGGYIIIEQTEALISIDVNTGRNVGSSDKIEETVLRTNLQAAEEIPRQLRLRNLGGIIIIDFIDMEKRQNRTLVYDVLSKALKRDRARTKIYQISRLGLVEMSRQRISDSLYSVTFEDCPYCSGEGVVKSPLSMGLEIVRNIRKAFCDRKTEKVQISLHPQSKEIFIKTFERELSGICLRHRKEVEIKSNRDLRLDEIRLTADEKKKK